MSGMKILAILIVVFVLLGVTGCGILSYLWGTPFSSYRYQARYVNIDMDCKACSKAMGMGSNEAQEWYFTWTTGKRVGDQGGNGSMKYEISLEPTECNEFSLTVFKNGDNGTLSVGLTFENLIESDMLAMKGEKKQLTLDTPCIKD